MSKLSTKNCKIKLYRGALAVVGPELDDLFGDGAHITVLPPQEKKLYSIFNRDIDFDIYDLGNGQTASSLFHVVACPQIQLERSRLGLEWVHLHITTDSTVNDDHGADKGPKSLQYKVYTKEECQVVLECLKKHFNVLGDVFSGELNKFATDLIDKITQSTDTLDLHSFKANLLFKAKKYDEAVYLATEVLGYNPENIQVLVILGDSYYKQGLFEYSLEGYWKALVNLTTSEDKISQYLLRQLHRLWKKSVVLLETIKEPKLNFSATEKLVYQTKRSQIFSPMDEIEENHLNQSRNRIIVYNYKMPRFFSWIVPLVLAGMSTPKSRSDIIHLEIIGIRKIITLTEEEPLPKEWFDNTRIKNEFWPVSNYYPPAIVHVDTFIQMLIQTIYSDEPGSVLVHCGGGKGRAGSLLACYLILFGLTVPPTPCLKCKFKPSIRCLDASCAYGQYPKMNATEAIELIRNLRPGSIETTKQEEFVALFASTCWARIGSQKSIYSGIDPHEDVEGKIKCAGIMNNRPSFIILQGLPASGKSWFSSILKQNNWLVVSQDESGSKEICERELSSYSKRLGSDIKVVVDRCNPTKADIVHWKNIAGNPPTVLISFKASEEECIERAQNRLNHPTVAPGMAKSVITSFAKQMQEITTDTIPTIYNIDTFNDSKALLKHFGVKIPEKQDFYKYPRTRHLLNLGAATRDDLVLAEADSKPFFVPASGTIVTVEEKIDGANIGFRLDKNGEIIAQNRNHILTEAAHEQFKALPSWIKKNSHGLMSVLAQDRILYGEWMYALHSCSYSKLPDYFIAFDIYDINTDTFLSRSEFDKLLAKTSITSCPRIHVDFPISRSTIDALISEKSAFSDSTIREGLVFRIDKEVLLDKAKIVRTDFIAAIMRAVLKAYRKWRRFTLLKRWRRNQKLKLFLVWFTKEQRSKQREWRNEIRAQVHCNYIKYAMVWNGWIEYVDKRRNESMLQRKSFGLIKSLYDTKKAKVELFNAAIQYNRHSLLQIFSRWKTAYDRCIFDQQRIIVLGHSKTRQKLLHWKERCVQKGLEHVLQHRAVNYHTLTVFKSAFTLWRKQVSLGEVVLKITPRYFKKWYIRLAETKKTKILHEKAVSFDYKLNLYRYWKKWKWRIREKTLANDFQFSHQMKLAKQFFAKSKRIKSMEIMASSIYDSRLVISYFKKIAAGFDVRLNLIHDQEMLPGKNYYQSKMLKWVFNTLLSYKNLRLEKKERKGQADMYFKRKIYKYFELWNYNLILKKSERELCREAVDFCEQFQRKRYMLRWKVSLANRINQIGIGEMAVGKYQEHLKRMGLQALRNYTFLVEKKKQNRIDARYFHQNAILTFYFTKLKESGYRKLNKQISLQNKLQRVLKLKELEFKQIYVENWINKSILSLTSRHLESKSAKFHQNVAVFYQWASYAPNWKHVYNRRHVLPKTYWGLQVCKSVMSKWKEFVVEKKELALRIKQAKEWRDNLLCREGLYTLYTKSSERQMILQNDSDWKYLTERQKRLVCKYGMRWRYKVIGKKKASIFEWNIEYGVRPAPRMPRFLLEDHSFPPPNVPRVNLELPSSKVIIHRNISNLSDETLQCAFESEGNKLEVQNSSKNRNNFAVSQPKFLETENIVYHPPSPVTAENIKARLIEWQEKSQTYINDQNEVEQLESKLLEYCEAQYSHSLDVDFADVMMKLRVKKARIAEFNLNKLKMKDEIKDLQRQLSLIRANKS
ncbi:hypothetical protein HDV06_002335 [Boothiomyces sp. JEL0866]|nr:hypothetical protein HDV06_002335 [Boothiomyces sp. JEL0866]